MEVVVVKHRYILCVRVNINTAGRHCVSLFYQTNLEQHFLFLFFHYRTVSRGFLEVYCSFIVRGSVEPKIEAVVSDL